MNTPMSRLFPVRLFIIVLFPTEGADEYDHGKPGQHRAGDPIIHGNHFAYSSASVPSRHRLVLMIQGTGTSAKDLSFFDTAIASMGYPVISSTTVIM